MTEISTPEQPLALIAPLKAVLRRALTGFRGVFRSRRIPHIDRHHGDAHLLRDIGLRRSYDIPPSASHGRFL